MPSFKALITLSSCSSAGSSEPIGGGALAASSARSSLIFLSMLTKSKTCPAPSCCGFTDSSVLKKLAMSSRTVWFTRCCDRLPSTDFLNPAFLRPRSCSDEAKSPRASRRRWSVLDEPAASTLPSEPAASLPSVGWAFLCGFRRRPSEDRPARLRTPPSRMPLYLSAKGTSWYEEVAELVAPLSSSVAAIAAPAVAGGRACRLVRRRALGGDDVGAVLSFGLHGSSGPCCLSH